MRYFAMAPRDNSLHVDGVENLYCAGEKAGLLVGHTEAIVTGVLAGYNQRAVCHGKGTADSAGYHRHRGCHWFCEGSHGDRRGKTKKYTFSVLCTSRE